MLHFEQIRRQMHEITGLHVEKRAVIEILSYIDIVIVDLIKQSQFEHHKNNSNRILQGLPEKKRLDQDSIKQAIALIKTEQHSESSERTGGRTQETKKGERNDKHTPETKDMGVEII